ncbi:hypothetical protein [Shinella sedimenti]|uniref:Lipoprotein n=1 Tax=Shinella sedimenti TaxID=2919913 RepID=A0ABT0CT44_9HYPH|nr:hypothetical protein [Shinella sedimenti]MCJ8151770.1 hypothetical protein [Shinella sedimenti]
MSPFNLMAVIGCFAIALPSPSYAIDWLGNRIDSNLENNLRTHQQQGARQYHGRSKKNLNARRPLMQHNNRKMSAQAERQARAEGQRIMESHRPRLEREHRRRVAQDGKASADRWLKQEAYAIGVQVGRQMTRKYAGK